jgi:hypothetical protein
MLQSGLHVDFVSLDQVAGRFCRLNWERKFTVPCTLDDNGIFQILLLVKELPVFEMRISRVLQVIEECSQPKKDFLDELFDRPPDVPSSPPFPNPRTMTTTPSSPKRRSSA